MKVFRRRYGAGPLHLLALLASFAVAGAAIVRWFDSSSSDTLRILIWFGAGALLHDIVFLPFYSIIDRIAAHRVPVNGHIYLRVPALISAIVLLVFAPEILRLGNNTYAAASGGHQNVYLLRYLVLSGALFGLSGLACAARFALRRRAS